MKKVPSLSECGAAVLVIGAGVAVSGLFAIFSKPIVGLFTDNPDKIAERKKEPI